MSQRREAQYSQMDKASANKLYWANIKANIGLFMDAILLAGVVLALVFGGIAFHKTRGNFDDDVDYDKLTLVGEFFPSNNGTVTMYMRKKDGVVFWETKTWNGSCISSESDANSKFLVSNFTIPDAWLPVINDTTQSVWASPVESIQTQASTNYKTGSIGINPLGQLQVFRDNTNSTSNWRWPAGDPCVVLSASGSYFAVQASGN